MQIIPHQIQLFPSNGTFVSMFGGNSEKDENSKLSKPKNIAVDSKGRIYVVDTTNNNVQLFMPN